MVERNQLGRCQRKVVGELEILLFVMKAGPSSPAFVLGDLSGLMGRNPPLPTRWPRHDQMGRHTAPPGTSAGQICDAARAPECTAGAPIVQRRRSLSVQRRGAPGFGRACVQPSPSPSRPNGCGLVRFEELSTGNEGGVCHFGDSTLGTPSCRRALRRNNQRPVGVFVRHRQ
jgi:hypothetical protein